MSLRTWMSRLSAIGDRPGLSDRERLQRRFLIYMGVLMSGGGLLWGSLSLYFGLFWQAVIPFGYTLGTIFNLSYFRLRKNFERVRFVQVLMSLLLPFFFQWGLGGFGTSGAVMLWAMLAIVGSMTFSNAKQSVQWLIVYSILTVFSGLIDATVHAEVGLDPSPEARTTFFVLNFVVISNLVFGLTIYLLEQNRKATGLAEELSSELASRSEDLEAALSQFQVILANMADGLLAVDTRGEINVTNRSLGQLLGVTGELAPEQVPHVLSSLAQRSIDLEDVVKSEFSLPGERIGSAVASPLHVGEETRRCVGAVVIVRDVTLEKEIDRMKTDFIATVSHELRTPLTSVLGFAMVTQDKLEQRVFPQLEEGADQKTERAIRQIRGNIDIMVSEGERLTALINDVLDISKMEAGGVEWKLEPLHLEEVLERACEATSSLFSEGLVLKTEMVEGLPQLTGDFDRLVQVVINLISNGAKFTEEGQVTVSARTTDEGVELCVADTGMGIAVSEQAAVFERFKQVGDTLTNKPRGTGLGLPICKQIVQAHHGRIWVESSLGEGARFYVQLPVDGKTARPHVGPLESSDTAHLIEHIERHLPTLDAGADHPEILVIDDDENLRELLRQQLSQRGFEVRLAVDGSTGIAAVREHHPHLIILDIMMPGISGFDVAAVLKADPETADIPIIVMSIYHDEERGYRLGVDRYLSKPTSAEVLLREIQGLIRSSHAKRSLLLVEASLPESVREALEERGFQTFSSCLGRQCLKELHLHVPDIVIIGEGVEEAGELVRAIRTRAELARVPVIRLMNQVADA